MTEDVKETLVDSAGNRYLLGRKLASGGEGSIFFVEQNEAVVVKRYHNEASTKTAAKLKELELKISYMFQKPPQPPEALRQHQHAFWTWPLQLLKTNQGNFVGYLMPYSKGIKGEEFLQFSSGFSWKARIQAALYLTHSVQASHTTGYIIGDLNPRNLFFTLKEEGQQELLLPTLTDTDSFQINDLDSGDILFNCTVQNPEYSAPELINAYTFNRSIEQDYFTLALVLFQILSLGVHPFSGTVKNQVVQEIKNNISKGRNVISSKELVAPKHMIELDIFPPDMLKLFDQTFRLGHTVSKSRTSTSDWIKHLSSLLEDGLSQCDKTPQHYYSQHLGQCPWCSYSKRLGADPFNPRLRLMDNQRRRKGQTGKVIRAGTDAESGFQTSAPPLVAVNKSANALRAEVGNNTFFGPVPDELLPGYSETEASAFSVSKDRSFQNNAPAVSRKNQVGKWLWMFGLALLLVSIVWLAWSGQGKAFYNLQIRSRLNNWTQAKEQPEVKETVLTTPTSQQLEPTTQTVGSLSLSIEACIDSDGLEPYNCNLAMAADIGAILQGARSNIRLTADHSAQKQRFWVEGLSPGRYTLIIDDSKVGLKRCPGGSGLFNPTSTSLTLQQTVTVLFVYCASPG